MKSFWTFSSFFSVAMKSGWEAVMPPLKGHLFGKMVAHVRILKYFENSVFYL